MEITRFWDALPERTRDALRQAGTSVTKKPGTLLTREHTHTSQVFILHSGAVKVWVDRAGDAAILDVLGPGDLVGELEAVDGGVRHANAEVLTQVRATVLTADRFRRVLDDHPGTAWTVAAVLAERLRDANELRIAHFPDDPERRLAGRLLRLMSRFGAPLPADADGNGAAGEGAGGEGAGGEGAGGEGAGVEVRLPISQQDLGRWAGMGRRKVAQILAAESVRGGLAVARNAIVVRSADTLHRLAGGD